MNTIKKALLLLCITMNFTANAQTKDSTAAKKIIFKSYFSDVATPNYNIDFTSIDITKKATISIFNTSMFNYDHYVHTGKQYTYTNSTLYYRNSVVDILFDNNSLKHANSFMQNKYKYPIKDSFNPYGASSMESAILGGFLGLLFND